MEKYMLDGVWTLEFTYKNKKYKADADIPSNVESVLLRMGLIDDIMPADYPYALKDFELVDDWKYETSFYYEERAHFLKELVFEGIDTVADIYINGKLALECRNMHIAHRIPLDGLAKEGENKLTVLIRSSELYAREHIHDDFSFSHGKCAYYDSQAYLRKARYQWGWDNAPRLLTSGIFRSVYIESLPMERFGDVYIYTSRIDGEYVYLYTNWTFKTKEADLGDYRITLCISDKGMPIASVTSDIGFIAGRLVLAIPREDVKLWWPRGFGEPYLYDATLTMSRGGKRVAEHTARIGIRTLEFKMSEDVEGREGHFDFTVNGERIYIRGTNHKPLDPLPSIADKKLKAGAMLGSVLDLGCNMIRVWGGGIYEDEYLYDWCDENGILVWQDFMFACEIPPIDDDYSVTVKMEAEYIIKKYRNHPSLAVWCGDNENDLSLTWVAAKSTARPSDSIISRKVLKEAVLRFDPMRSYIPSSPYLSDRAFEAIFDPSIGIGSVEAHLYPDSVSFSETLRNTSSIFIGETGPIGVNAISTSEQMFEREKGRAERLWNTELTVRNDIHQSDEYFTAWRRAGEALCRARYGRDFAFSEFDDYTVAVNLACAEIFKDVIEYCRVSDDKTGVIWWSLADMWPMLFNYSVIDCYGRPKLPYHFIKKSQEAFALMGVREKIGGELMLYAANDTLDLRKVSYTVTSYDVNMKKEIIISSEHTQAKNSVGKLRSLGRAEEPKLFIIKWTDGEREYSNHVFSASADYDTSKKWLRILAEELGFLSEIYEKI